MSGEALPEGEPSLFIPLLSLSDLQQPPSLCRAGTEATQCVDAFSIGCLFIVCLLQVALDGKQPTKDELVVSISTPTTSHRKVCVCVCMYVMYCTVPNVLYVYLLCHCGSGYVNYRVGV